MEGTVGVMVIIRDSHSRDSGSIPGRCKIIFFFVKIHFYEFYFLRIIFLSKNIFFTISFSQLQCQVKVFFYVRLIFSKNRFQNFFPNFLKIIFTNFPPFFKNHFHEFSLFFSRSKSNYLYHDDCDISLLILLLREFYIRRQSIYVFATISLVMHYHNISGKAHILTECYKRFSSNACIARVSLVKVACVIPKENSDKLNCSLLG